MGVISFFDICNLKSDFRDSGLDWPAYHLFESIVNWFLTERFRLALVIGNDNNVFDPVFNFKFEAFWQEWSTLTFSNTLFNELLLIGPTFVVRVIFETLLVLSHVLWKLCLRLSVNTEWIDKSNAWPYGKCCSQ